MRAVLDPNVLVSALLAPDGSPARLIIGWFAGEFELIVSEKLLAELARVLAYPKIRARVAPEDADGFVALLRDAADLAADNPEPPARSEDAGDDYLLALAESEGALLVSGDRHLLTLAPRLPVVSPREFLDSLTA